MFWEFIILVGILAIITMLMMLFGRVDVNRSSAPPGYKGMNGSYLDEVYSKSAVRGDKLEHLSKQKAQQYRGVDLYVCTSCGVKGAPWEIQSWTKDLDTVEGYTIPGGCKCGGTVVLYD